MEVFSLNASLFPLPAAPEPYLPDVEVLRVNLSLASGSQVDDEGGRYPLPPSVLSSCPLCLNASSLQWTDSACSLMHYALPMLFTLGLVCGLFSLSVCVRSGLTYSYRVYRLSLVVASLCVLAGGWLLRLEDYTTRHSDTYQHTYSYLKGLHSWFSWAALWTLVGMLLERFTAMLSSKPNRPLLSPLQAAIATVLVFLACCVSAIPQFWEYQVTQVLDMETGQTRKYYQKSELANSMAYRSVYFSFQLAVSMFLPYPLMIIIVVMLGRGGVMKPIGTPSLSPDSQQQAGQNICEMSTSVQSDASTIVNKEMPDKPPSSSFTRMLVSLTGLYLITTTPLSFLNIADHINPHTNWDDEKLYFALNDLFQFLFYSFYSLQIVVFFCFCKDFKHQAIALVCWCTDFKCTARRLPPGVPV